MPKYTLGYRTASNFVNRNEDPNGPGHYYKEKYEKEREYESGKISCSKIREKYEEIRVRSQSQKTKRTNH